MEGTSFYNAHTIEEVLTLLDRYQENAVIVNGGTDIVEKIREGKVKPEAIVYIQNVDSLKEITEKDGYIVIGGAVSYKSIQESSICQRYAGLIETVRQIGSPAIRNVATPAGNIGTAAPAPDCSVMLLALDAQIVLASIQGERTVDMKDIFVGKYQTAIMKNELIKEIRIPNNRKNICSAYSRMARRKAQDIGKILVGVSLEIEGNSCKDIRIALGALNSTPFRAYSIEEVLKGMEMNEGLDKIKGVFPEEAKPRASRFKSYKEQVTGVFIERAIKKSYERALGGGDNV